MVRHPVRRKNLKEKRINKFAKPHKNKKTPYSLREILHQEYLGKQSLPRYSKAQHDNLFLDNPLPSPQTQNPILGTNGVPTTVGRRLMRRKNLKETRIN